MENTKSVADIIKKVSTDAEEEKPPLLIRIGGPFLLSLGFALIGFAVQTGWSTAGLWLLLPGFLCFQLARIADDYGKAKEQVERLEHLLAILEAIEISRIPTGSNRSRPVD